MKLLCPICAEELNMEGHSCHCGRGHSFDVARQGYVNLLPVQQKHSLNPGDTKEQVLSRRAFLDGGFYQPIADALCKLAKEAGHEGMRAQTRVYTTRIQAGQRKLLISTAYQKPKLNRWFIK